MPALTLNGWTIPVATCTQEELEIGSLQRAFSGRARRSIRARKRQWGISTSPLLHTEAVALEGLLLAKGEQFPGETDAYSAKGLPAYQDNGITSVIGAGAYGNSLWPRGATTNLLSENQSTGTDKLGDTTGWVGCNGTAYNDVTAGVTLTSSTTYAWQGTRSLFVQFSGGAFRSVRTTSIAVSPSTQYTWSCYMRGTATLNAALRYVVQDQTDTNLGISSTFVALNSGWNRFTVTFTTGAATSAIQVFAQEIVDSSYQFYMDGAQLEPGPAASAWTATSFAGVNLAYDIAAHVSRGCDAITLAAWARVPSASGSVLAAISDTGFTNYLKLAYGGSTTINAVGPAGSVSMAWAVPGSYAHIAVVVAPSAVKLYFNGVLQSESSTIMASTPLTAMTRLWLGNFNGANTWGGYVDELLFLPYAATAAQLAGLASLTAAPALQPALTAAGDIVGTLPLSVVASEVRATYLVAAKSGIWRDNMATVDFLLSEV